MRPRTPVPLPSQARRALLWWTSNPRSAASFWFGFPASVSLSTERIQRSQTLPPLGGEGVMGVETQLRVSCVSCACSLVSCGTWNRPRSSPVVQADPVLSVWPGLLTHESTLRSCSLESCSSLARSSSTLLASFISLCQNPRTFQNNHPKSGRGGATDGRTGTCGTQWPPRC